MNLQSQSPSADHNVSQVFAEVWSTGKVTKDECDTLANALLNGDLSSDSYKAIDRISHALKRGWLSLEPRDIG